MMNTASVVPEEQQFILSSLSPGRIQRRLALAVVLTLLVAFFIMAGPLSTIQLARIDAFVPVYATAVFVIDSITAVLLFAQFSILRSRALLVIASGYFFTALAVILWMLTFPGVAARLRPLPRGPRTGTDIPWLRPLAGARLCETAVIVKRLEPFDAVAFAGPGDRVIERPRPPGELRDGRATSMAGSNR